ncbi:MAG: ARMT1-like domain-containing protein [Cyanobacteria bacterium P01_G01_bin.54]
MNEHHPSPAPIQRVHGQGFVDYTITRRLPKILLDIKAELETQGTFDAAQVMLQSILDEDPINLEHFARPTDYWQTYLSTLKGLTWGDLPFFDLEFLFYHGLNSIVSYFDKGIDVFYTTRKRALAEAIPALDSALVGRPERSERELLYATIRGSLLANEADYSQLVTSRNSSKRWAERLLLDDSEQFVSSLVQAPSGMALHLIADNAGHELCWDLVMVATLLRQFAGIHVTIHVKPWPMFVSDALAVDIEETLEQFLDHRRSPALQSIGQRLRQALEVGQCQVCAEADWGEPRHFNALDKRLGTRLSHAVGVIVKGDLNYRRLVRDLQWPVDTPTDVATVGVPFRVIALRVLKSDALVGLELPIANRAARKIENWKTAGHFAVIQSL